MVSGRKKKPAQKAAGTSGLMDGEEEKEKNKEKEGRQQQQKMKKIKRKHKCSGRESNKHVSRCKCHCTD